MEKVNRGHLAGLELANDLLQTIAGFEQDKLDDLIAQARAAPEQEPVGVITYGGMTGVNAVVSVGRKLHELPIGSSIFAHPAPVEQRSYDLSVEANDVLRAEIRSGELTADASEVLRAELAGAFKLLGPRTWEQVKAAEQRADAAERKLAERDALLREFRDYLPFPEQRNHVDTLLSATAQPANPKCATCFDVGIVGHSDICPGCEKTWTAAQPAEVKS